LAKKRNSNNRVIQPEPIPTVVNRGVELMLSPGHSMYIRTGNSQHQGARQYQEDSFGYSNITDNTTVTNKGMFAVLADGMGGLANGKQMADYAVRGIIASFDYMNPHLPRGEQLLSIAQTVNKGACELNASSTSGRGGATLVLAYIYKNRIYWVTAGDSRLYCLRNGKMFQMNEDHDYKNQLFHDYLNGSGITLAEIESDRQKDSLVSFIGKEGLPCVDVGSKGYKINPGDVFVLCSDGIYNAMSTDSMSDIIMNNDAQTASDLIASQVVRSALPGQDNLTVMVIKCDKQ